MFSSIQYFAFNQYDIMTVVFKESNCFVTSSSPYLVDTTYGYIYNVTSNDTIGTACSINYMPNDIDEKILGMNPSDRNPILQNMPAFFCSSCQNIPCEEYAINETYQCYTSTTTHDATIIDKPYFSRRVMAQDNQVVLCVILFRIYHMYHIHIMCKNSRQ
jgi:hypothetical protein